MGHFTTIQSNQNLLKFVFKIVNTKFKIKCIMEKN